MIRFECPGCKKHLNAKDGLAGQQRKCPNCGSAVTIPAPEAAAAETPAAETPATETPTTETPTVEVNPGTEQGLLHVDAPERLDRRCQYIICDKSKIIAAWQNDGNGWTVKMGSGFRPARRNQGEIPTQGNFTLIEMTISMTDDGLRLKGIQSYKLTPRYALVTLERGDDYILRKIIGPGSLNREQKNIVRTRIREQFMAQVWEDATEVFAYLTNGDFHSQGVTTSPASG